MYPDPLLNDVVTSGISSSSQIKQFRLATYAHNAVKKSNDEVEAATIIKRQVESDGLNEGVRVTEAIINGQEHIVTAVPAKYTDLNPSTGDVAIVPKLKTLQNGVAQDGHVAVVTAEDAHNL